MKLNLTLHIHADQPIQVHLHGSPAEVTTRLDAVLAQLTTLTEGALHMGVELDRLRGEVNEARTVMQGASALIKGLAQKIRDLATDPAALNELADGLDGDATELAAAVQANTPAEPDPPADQV